jgi:hypothetical protein
MFVLFSHQRYKEVRGMCGRGFLANHEYFLQECERQYCFRDKDFTKGARGRAAPNIKGDKTLHLRLLWASTAPCWLSG